MKKAYRIAALLLAHVFIVYALLACAEKKNDSNSVIVSIGDEKITLSTFKSAFTSFADYYSQTGVNPYTSSSDLERFQDMVLEAVVNDTLTLYHAKAEGFTLTEQERSDIVKTATEEHEQIRQQLMQQAEQQHESDPSKTVEQHFDALMREMSEYYTGAAMSFYEYAEEYMKQALDTALISAYQQRFASSIQVSDEEFSEWFEKQYASDEKLYSENPEQFLQNATEYELYRDSSEDIIPPLYIPEGYSRVFDIVVYPSEEPSSEYRSLQEELSRIADQCSAMLFSDALAGNNEHSTEIAELIASYNDLKEQADRMYESYQSSARKKIDEAYALLADGESFTEVMKRFSEAQYNGDNEDPAIPQIVLDKGELISTRYDCGSDDWSSTFKDIFGMTEKGEFSSVFSDEDGSLHIIMRGEDEQPGRADAEPVKADIVKIIQNEKSITEWQDRLAEWREDPQLQIDMEAVRKVGAERLG